MIKLYRCYSDFIRSRLNWKDASRSCIEQLQKTLSLLTLLRSWKSERRPRRGGERVTKVATKVNCRESENPGETSRCKSSGKVEKKAGSLAKAKTQAAKVAAKETWESTGKSIGFLKPLICRSVQDFNIYFNPTNLRTLTIVRFLVRCLVVLIT